MKPIIFFLLIILLLFPLSVFSQQADTKAQQKLLQMMPEMLMGQQADTITITEAHQKLLPELVQKIEAAQKQLQELNEKVMILILGYVSDEKGLTALKEGRVLFSDDRKKIIVKHE